MKRILLILSFLGFSLINCDVTINITNEVEGPASLKILADNIIKGDKTTFEKSFDFYWIGKEKLVIPEDILSDSSAIYAFISSANKEVCEKKVRLYAPARRVAHNATIDLSIKPAITAKFITSE